MGRQPERQRSLGEWYSRDEAIMGTSVRVELWSREVATAEAAIDAVMDEMHRIEAVLSPFKPASELSAINRDAGAGWVQVTAETYALLARAIDFSRLSDGAFDITYASAGRLYDYRAGVKPSEQALAEACQAIGWQHLQLDPATRSVRFGKPGMSINLGGFAKGHAVDRGAAILQRRGIRHAVVTAGGDSRIVGDRGGRPWMIGIRDPRKQGAVVAVLPLDNVSMSTSGDYERFFERDGERCHHLIDPRTGKSPSTVRSVTILADNGLAAEALSKCVFVLGVQRGLMLVQSLPGVDAVVVDAQGALHFSNGLQAAKAAARPV